MDIFDGISLLGGLAMFLYGMRLMGDGLKAGSSGTLKKAMEKATNTPVKAFLLGLLMTAVIQSSTATIVITSGLVGAGIISLRQSLGVVIGANVGTGSEFFGNVHPAVFQSVYAGASGHDHWHHHCHGREIQGFG